METILKKYLPTFGGDIVSMADARYLQEPRGRYFASAMPVFRPRSTAQVSQIVQFCNQHKIGIVPYGGGTGLVGGQVRVTDDETIILSLERMNAIQNANADENAITVQAGAILQNIQQAADQMDRLFPLSLASQGSCQIGGNLSTNAGGVQVLRYGNTRDLCLGIEAVLPDGTIYNGLHSLRKDNTGYDIRHLLIGAEGTLGIITAACLKLFPKPTQKATAMLVVPDPNAAITLLSTLNTVLGGAITAFELIHAQGLQFLAEKLPHVRQPFQEIPTWSVLVEVSGGDGADLTQALTDALATKFDDGLVLDAVLAQSVAQAQAIWDVRENIPEANRMVGAISSQDISIPISRIPDFIAKTPALLAHLGALQINCFGHLGDGNLHYNVYPPTGKNRDDFVSQRDEIATIIHDQTHAFGGSISAEHGIGRMKRDDLLRYGDAGKIAAMRAVKAALDPNNIMNPDAVIAQN